MPKVPEMCRLCLQKSADNPNLKLTKIFGNKLSRISEKIASCLGICVLEEDVVPPLICNNCLNCLEKFNEFFEKARSSDMFMSSLMYKSDFENTNTSMSGKDSERFVSCESSLTDSHIQNLPGLAKSDGAIYFPGGRKIHTDRSDSSQSNINDNKNCNTPFVFRCPKCDELFSSEKSLIEHEKEHNRTTNFSKSLHNLTKKNSKRRKSKVRFSPKLVKKVSCTTCCTCKKHRTRKRRITNRICKEKFYKNNHKHCCIRCAKTFKSEMDFRQSKKKFKCHVCGRHFREKSKLDKHIKSHLKLKFNECKICNREFFTLKELKQHTLSHKKTSYKCKKCNKHFIFKKLLDKHTKCCARPKSCKTIK